MDVIRILIADDHPLFRDGLRALLESVPEMQAIGKATNGDEVLAQAQALQPEVILMDIKMNMTTPKTNAAFNYSSAVITATTP